MATQERCGVCTRDLVKPKLFPCFHTFCGECVRTLIKETAQNGKLKCPVCQKDVPIPKGGGKDLPNNFCVNHADDRKYFCSKHEGMELKFYCTECSKLVCVDCAVVAHKNHNQIDLRDVGKETRKKLSLWKTTLENMIARQKIYSEQLQSKMEDIETTAKKSCDDIDRQVKQICTEVQKLGEDMKEQIIKIKQAQTNKFASVKNNNEKLGDCYKRGFQYSEFALAEQSSVPVLEIAPGVEALIKEMESTSLNVPQIKYTYFYSPETKADVGLSILKQYVGDLQMLSEKTFMIGFSVSQVAKDKIFWSKEETTINFLSWHVGCMHTDKSTLGIYLKLKDGEYKTLKSLRASYALTLLNKNNKSLSVTIQDDCPRSFLPGNIGGWSFIDWKRLTKENGYLDELNSFQVKATVRIERLDTN